MSLPTELWVSIFQELVQGYKDEVKDTATMRSYLRNPDHQAPLVLCRVCKQWRDIAISEPTLWSSIWIIASNRNQEAHPLQPPLNTIRLWIKRSRALPLSIFFDTYEGSAGSYLDSRLLGNRDSPFHRDTTECFRMLFGVMNRWKRARLWLPRHGDLEEHGASTIDPHLVSSGAPLLESLDIRALLERPDPSHTPHLALICSQSPKLRHFTYPSIHNYNLDVAALRSAQVPLGQLHHLSIHTTISIDAVMSLLRHVSENIQSCFFGAIIIRGQRPSSVSSESPFACPRLQHLTLRLLTQNDGDRLMDVLDYLCLPSLSQLTAVGGKGGTWYKYQHFTERSECKIEKLFMSSQMRAEDLITFLRLNPDLKRFRHNWPFMAYNVQLFEVLAEYDDVAEEFVVCPKLVEFGCNESCMNYLSVSDAFIQFLERRTEVQKDRLKELVIFGSRGHSARNLPLPLRPFSAKGLDIRYSLEFEETRQRR